MSQATQVPIRPNQSEDFDLRMTGVCYQYPSQRGCLLSDVNLEVQAGDFFALIGRSGTGKTTLLNILAGYLAPQSGTCVLGDTPITGPDRTRVPIFQEDGLWPWLRASENVTLPTLLTLGVAAARSCQPQAHALLQTTGLPPDAFDKYPKHLSAGMKKRVEIARALFVAPPVILADEPLAILDSRTREEIQDLLGSLWAERNMTVVFSTHDLEEALFLATRIAILKQVGSSATITEVLENPFRGDRTASRRDPSAYFAFYDQLKQAL